MTALLEGAKKLVARGSDLGARIEGLDAAADAARGRLDDAVVDEVREVADRASGRMRLSAEHTVVAIAGATGSGKSSTFNWLTGLDLSAVGVRRPTTSWATACVWGTEGAAELLEWLGIPARHQVTRDSMLDIRREDHSLDGRGHARPPRPRLDRALPPPRGGPAGAARRPAGVGPGPAEVRRRGDPRPLPRAVHHAPGRDAGRAEPDRHRPRVGTRLDGRRRTPAPRRRGPRSGAGDGRQRPRGRRHDRAQGGDRAPGVGEEVDQGARRGGPEGRRRPARGGVRDGQAARPSTASASPRSTTRSPTPRACRPWSRLRRSRPRSAPSGRPGGR